MCKMRINICYIYMFNSTLLEFYFQYLVSFFYVSWKLLLEKIKDTVF